jgi:transcriptional regulator with XRE-family HTH domain
MSTRKDTLVPDSPQVPDQDADMPLYLKEWRTLRGLTQQQLADRIGTAKSYISKWETKERPLRDINWIKKICEVLKITPDNLYQMPPKSVGKLTPSSGAMPTLEHTASEAVSPEGIEMIEKRVALHESLEELPDELLDTANSLINRLKGLAGSRPPHPSKRGTTKS